MTIVLNPLIDSTNQRFDVINRQMNRMAAALDVNDNPNNHNVHNEEDIPPPPPPEHECQELPKL